MFSRKNVSKADVSPLNLKHERVCGLGDRKMAWLIRMLTPAVLLTCCLTLSCLSFCSPPSFCSSQLLQLETLHFLQIHYLTNPVPIPSIFLHGTIISGDLAHSWVANSHKTTPRHANTCSLVVVAGSWKGNCAVPWQQQQFVTLCWPRGRCRRRYLGVWQLPKCLLPVISRTDRRLGFVVRTTWM